MKVVIKLSPEEVANVLWNYVREELGHEPLSSAKFEVEEVSHGRMEDYTTLEFTGASIDVNMPGPVKVEDNCS